MSQLQSNVSRELFWLELATLFKYLLLINISHIGYDDRDARLILGPFLAHNQQL